MVDLRTESRITIMLVSSRGCFSPVSSLADLLSSLRPRSSQVLGILHTQNGSNVRPASPTGRSRSYADLQSLKESESALKDDEDAKEDAGLYHRRVRKQSMECAIPVGEVSFSLAAFLSVLSRRGQFESSSSLTLVLFSLVADRQLRRHEPQARLPRPHRGGERGS